MRFSYEQVVFIAKWTLAAAFDRIESSLPDTISLEEYLANKKHIQSMTATAMDTAAMSLAIFFAQSTGEGMGVYDWAGSTEFRQAVDEFVAERTDPKWEGLKPGEPCYPETEVMATMYAEEWLLTMDHATRLKIERKCPRCHKRLYHFATANGTKVKIVCSDCGHKWTGRYLAEEWT